MLTTNDTKQIQLVFVSGTNDLGQPIYKNRFYRSVNPANATLDNVYAFGQAVAALSEWPLDRVILATDQEIYDVV
jgi:hypothetical protein